MKIFQYFYFSLHFHLGDPPLAQEDYFPPKSDQHRHLLFKVKNNRINKLYLKNHDG